MNSILQMISELDLHEKYEVITQIKGLIMAGIVHASHSIRLHTCPHCGSTCIIKKGKDSSGRQRYIQITSSHSIKVSNDGKRSLF